MCQNIIFPILFMSIGLLFIGISLPLIFEKMPPNDFYGFRTPKTFSSKEIWYKANKYMGKQFIWLGSIMIVYNIVLILFKTAMMCYEPVINLILLTGGTAVVGIRSFLYLRKL